MNRGSDVGCDRLIRRGGLHCVISWLSFLVRLPSRAMAWCFGNRISGKRNSTSNHLTVSCPEASQHHPLCKDKSDAPELVLLQFSPPADTFDTMSMPAREVTQKLPLLPTIILWLAFLEVALLLTLLSGELQTIQWIALAMLSGICLAAC